MAVFRSIYPFTQEPIAAYRLHTDQEVQDKLDRAGAAFPSWATAGFAARSKVLYLAAALLRANQEKFAHLISMEMGKVFSESLAEVEKSAWVCEYYAEHAAEFLRPQPVEAGYYRSQVQFQPLGAVLAIMPWNFPFWQVFRYAAPTLMAGNTTLLKHAPNTTGCSLAIEKLFADAGLPPGVFQSLVVDVPMVEKILASGVVQAATLTGSERAGASVAALAGRYVKKTVLELGGSDPLIVLADADLRKAASTALASRLINAGQSCICAKRFIVEESVRETFTALLLEELKTYTQGDPFDPATRMGPVARPDLADKLWQQKTDSVRAGATLLYDGARDGCNLQPSLLDNVVPGMPAFDEETFGPLGVIIAARDEREALDLANRSAYGLSASIWTRDREKGEALARRLQAGAVFVNSLVKSDPRLPFGGIKKSGYGRELGREGIREFVNVQSIAIGE